MEILFIIACWIIWPILCSNLAKGKGHDSSSAACWGCFFGLFAVLYYLTVPERRR